MLSRRLKVKTKYKVKFYFGSVRVRIIPILKHIEAGEYPAKIARVLGLSKQHVHYYLKKMQRAGLIKRTNPRWPAFYKVTRKGKKVLTRSEGLVPGFVFRLHNFVVKYPVLAGPSVGVDWRRVEKMNWTALIGLENGVRVEKTSRNFLVYCDVLRGRDPHDLLMLAKDQADRVAASLCLKYGFRLGDGRLARKPHWGIYDPVAEVISKHAIISDDIANIDRSETYGEIDWFSPETAKDYLLMPGNVRSILAVLNEFAQGMRDHRAMITEIRELVEELRHTNRRTSN